ncbi:MAG TPA: DUF2321 domain-containing protein [Candidatus Paenibacillus intestinavium]|nr:DUF2321 domain-containing protein [Candidatus Paenibacillus intestinavium]
MNFGYSPPTPTYKLATICMNGHIVSSEQANYHKYCMDCGEGTTSECLHCKANIKGDLEHDYTFSILDRVQAYCYECGEPHPWTVRLLEHAVEIIGLDEKLSTEDKEIVKLAIPGLIVDIPSSPVSVAKYKKFMPKASDFVQEGIQNLLIDVVTDKIKTAIWG